MSNFEPSWRREMRRDILSCLLYGHILISKSRYWTGFKKHLVDVACQKNMSFRIFLAFSRF